MNNSIRTAALMLLSIATFTIGSPVALHMSPAVGNGVSIHGSASYRPIDVDASVGYIQNDFILGYAYSGGKARELIPSLSLQVDILERVAIQGAALKGYGRGMAKVFLTKRGEDRLFRNFSTSLYVGFGINRDQKYLDDYLWSDMVYGGFALGTEHRINDISIFELSTSPAFIYTKYPSESLAHMNIEEITIPVTAKMRLGDNVQFEPYLGVGFDINLNGNFKEKKTYGQISYLAVMQGPISPCMGLSIHVPIKSKKS